MVVVMPHETESVLELRSVGTSVRDISAQTGLSVKRIHRLLERARRDGDTRADYSKTCAVDLIRPLAAAGMTRAEIAKHLGMPAKRVFSVCDEHVIETQKDGLKERNREPRGLQIPWWVPEAFVADYRRLAKLHGEESAASTIRRWKNGGL